MIGSRTRIKRKTSRLGHLPVITAIGLGILYLARPLFPPKLENLVGSRQLMHSSPVVSLQGETEVGQSFAVSGDNLAAVSFHALEVTESAQHNPILFRLYKGDDLRPSLTKLIDARDIVPGRPYVVDIDPIKSANGDCYTFTLQNSSPTSGATLILAGTLWDSYQSGQLLVDFKERDRDLSFVAYSRSTPGRYLWTGVEVTAEHMIPLLWTITYLFLPLIVIWPLLRRIDADATVVLIAGLVSSPLLAALALVAADVSGVKFTPFMLFPIGVLLWLREFRAMPRALLWKRKLNNRTLSLILLSCFVVVVQMGLVKGIVLPSYLDSIHHVDLATRIATSRKLPAQLPLEGSGGPFIYHFGVHAFAASVTLFSNQAVAPATGLLLAGPVFLLLLSLGVYCLVCIAGYNHWCGLCGMILSNFALSMPAFALNWGKYPLILALATFCGVLALVVLSIKHCSDIVARTMVGLLIAANILTHTRMLVIWAIVAFAASVGTLKYLQNGKQALSKLAPLFIGPFAIIGLWLAPRWLNWLQFQNESYQSIPVAGYLHSDQFGVGLHPFEGIELVWITILIIGFCLMGSERLAPRFLIACAVLALTVLTLVPISFVPGARLLDAQFTQVALALPIAVGLAIVVGHTQQLSKNLLNLPTWLIPLLVSVTAVFALSARKGVPSLCCQLTSMDDIETMRWIQTSVHPLSTIGIAAVQWEDGQAIGVDGGYWTRTLTGMNTTLPSLLYGFGDAHSQTATTVRAMNVDTTIRTQGDICGLGIDYVYMGANPGSFELPVLEANPHLALVHRNGSTAIFQVEGCKER